MLSDGRRAVIVFAKGGPVVFFDFPLRTSDGRGNYLSRDMKNPSIDSTDLLWLGRLARALLGEDHAADDLVQQTVLAALETRVPTESRRAWLASVARRLAARHHRTQARRRTREIRASAPEELPGSAELVERAEIAERVTSATRELPEPFRRTILLHFMEGRSAVEIGLAEGKPADTVRWRLRRGLSLLREELMRRERCDWSACCVLLLPLTRAGRDATLATASAGASALGTATGAALLTMKTKMILGALLVLLVSSLWLVGQAVRESQASIPAEREVADRSGDTDEAPVPWQPDDTEPREIEAADPEAVVDEPATPFADGGDGADTRGVGSATPVGELTGTVVDEDGQPIAGATVYIVPSRSARAASPQSGVLAQTTTDAAGAFWLTPPVEAQENGAFDLGAVANGYLRSLVTSREVRPRTRLVLLPGRSISGRVVDEQGYPVPGLEVLASTRGAVIEHVSPAQSRLRAERALLADASSTYHQCRSWTDAAGLLVLSGLPEDETLEIRSLDPEWSIIESTRVDDDDAVSVEWVARRRLGVRLEVIDVTTGQPVELARAVFCCEVTFANGEFQDFSQWVGRGKGTVSFMLGPDLPQIVGRRIIKAVFYGTVGSGETEVQWRADPIVDGNGALGIAEVRVELDPSGGE